MMLSFFFKDDYGLQYRYGWFQTLFSMFLGNGSHFRAQSQDELHMDVYVCCMCVNPQNPVTSHTMNYSYSL